MSFVHDRRFVLVLRLVLGGVFLAAALPKLADPTGFAVNVDNYRILPELGVRLTALLLPPLELAIGLCLVFGVFDAGASLLAFALMLAFDGAVAAALFRGLDISCGCFDTDGGARVGLRKLLENVALTLVALRVWTGDRTLLSLGSRMTPRRTTRAGGA